MQLIFKLVSIDYTGGIGREWDFKITAGPNTASFGAILVKGNNTKNRTLIKSNFGNMNSTSLSVNVDATEIDKFPDNGNGSDTFKIDPKKTTAQKFSLMFTVKENKGPKINTTAKADLTLNFEALLIPDSNCPALSRVTPVVESFRNFPTSMFTSSQEGFTTILPGNFKFKDVYLPGKSSTSFCSDAVAIDCSIAKQVSADLQTYIDFKNKTNTKPLGNIYRNAGIIAAHESFHIKDLKAVSKKTFTPIKKTLEAKATSLGSATQVTIADAEKMKETVLLAAGEAWRADTLNGSNMKETMPDQISVTSATSFMKAVDAYRKANKCP
jgi:hypothetical protein